MKGTAVFKYGLKPVLKQPRLKLRDYFTSELPSVDDLKFPFGHSSLITPEMFGNDTVGDCAEAAAIEGIRLLTAGQGKEANFTTQNALDLYSAITNYNPADPSSDQGTDIHELFQYWQNTGITDADGGVHKVVDYVGLTPNNFDELLVALSLFDVVYVGFNVPDYAEDQFAAGQPWHLLPGRHQIVGGHCVPITGAQSATLADDFTWGGKGGMESTFYSSLASVAVVAITPDMFTNGKTLDGIDLAKLQADLPLLNTGTVSTKLKRKLEGVESGIKKVLGDAEASA
jgi:hypothetical protein